jgi:hypothetical protein
MTNSGNGIENLFYQMVKKGLVSTSHRWIEKAVEQRNPQLTLDLAFSTLLLYDRLDKKLLSDSQLN